MLDADLAVIYGVSTKRLNEAVKRNIDRFPADFRFQLSEKEWQNLRSQFVTSSEEEENLRSQIATSSSKDQDLQSQNVTTNEEESVAEEILSDLNAVKWGGRRYAPYAFTEHGAVMLSSVLRSERAVRASIQVVRAFVRMRTMLLNQEELAQRLLQLEANVDGNFQVVFDAINELMSAKAEEGQRRMIGFNRGEEE